MTRPRAIDFFSGEGGASTGYHRAGFDIYGVDNAPARLTRYPYPHHQGDAIDVMVRLIAGEAIDFTHPDGTVECLSLPDFIAVFGSPPCTGYTRGTAAIPDRLTRYDRLIAVTRQMFIEMGLPYVIENVADAKPELVNPVLYCGRMFGLGATDTDGTPLVVDRHRLFEASPDLLILPPGPHVKHDKSVQVAGAYGGARRDKREAREVRRGGYVPADLDVIRTMLGTPWMSETGCFLSIPPAYTEHIGAQVLDQITSSAAA
ncbi:hypothetical protein QUV83_08085 [Cellulomonas cellasea]|uniref:hypothetical protein n=1 Tax=Cellulomonas cellasea TaxID=43670 RepID=UPI0025A31BD2|nr:hypothetical protein [Cellulomonas cellasea]MDM8084718.1 hypothetical protein [Cellulomonas cellasea]